MNPSQPNPNSEAFGKEAEAMGLMRHGIPTDSNVKSSYDSDPHNPGVMSLEPPSYNSVVAQDASKFENRYGSSSIGNLQRSSTHNQMSMSMAMPGRIDTRRQIGFIDPVIMQPKSSDLGTVENRKYEHKTRKDAINQYTDMQQPTVDVMKKQGQSNNYNDECCRSICCVECCFSLCACID